MIDNSQKKFILCSIILESNFKDDIITMGNYKIPVLIKKIIFVLEIVVYINL